MPPRLFRVILPVSDIERAVRFYSEVLDIPGERVSLGRHYFDCGGTIPACFDPSADGDGFLATPHPDHVYFAVDDLEATHARASRAGCSTLDKSIQTRPWGERSFYASDPFGNPLSFVDAGTVVRGRTRGRGGVGWGALLSRKVKRVTSTSVMGAGYCAVS